MADSPDDRDRVKKLVAQDQDINDAQLKEFRMNLEANLASWEERSQGIRRWLVRAITILVLGYLGSILSMLANRSARVQLDGTMFYFVYGAIHWVFVIAALGSFFATAWLTVVYFVKYSPALRRARFDIHTAMILELQEQVVGLRQDLTNRDGRSPREN